MVEDQKEAVLPWRPIQLEGLQYRVQIGYRRRKKLKTWFRRGNPTLEFLTHIFASYIYVYIY